ncbi:MAG: 4-hydroxythreonine-4-phosphate dehydrogenase PdxA [Cytophagales bacterium]
MENKKKPVIGITLGDFNGVGPELILKICNDSAIAKICTPIIYGSTKIFNKYRKLLNSDEFHFYHIKEANQSANNKINIIHCWEEDFEIEPGKVTENAGKCAYLSLKAATNDVKKGHLDALVTAPINKHNIKNAEFNFIGHTEYLQQQFETKDVLMFMVSEDLKVAVASMHVALADVTKDITKEKLQSKLDLIIHSLKKDFGISKPKIAILGLNPHAGEDGSIGKEEIEIVKPLIAEMKHKGNLVFGPYPADGFFAAESYKKYDAVLAMYHDQGLIPFKMLAFENGVNFTAGLKIVRTSPDHGTAYNIAGRGTADESSFRAAIYMACDILKNRAESIAKS